jgi:hypothetical protein
MYFLTSRSRKNTAALSWIRMGIMDELTDLSINFAYVYVKFLMCQKFGDKFAFCSNLCVAL